MAKKRLIKKQATKQAVESLVKKGLSEKQAKQQVRTKNQIIRQEKVRIADKLQRVGLSEQRAKRYANSSKVDASTLGARLDDLVSGNTPRGIIEKLFSPNRGKAQGKFTGKREQNRVVLEYTKETLNNKGSSFFGLTPSEVRKIQKTPLSELDNVIKNAKYLDVKQRNENWSALSSEANKAQRYWNAVKNGRDTSRLPKPNYKKSFNGVNLRQLESKADEINAKVGLPQGDSYGYAVLYDSLTNGYTLEESMGRMEVDESIPSHYVAVY